MNRSMSFFGHAPSAICGGAAGSTGFEIPHVIDNDDVRIITGTMGRFPSFRPTGWRILETAQIIDG